MARLYLTNEYFILSSGRIPNVFHRFFYWVLLGWKWEQVKEDAIEVDWRK